MLHYGLIGKNLGHSFSKEFFTEKFLREGIQADYELFEISSVSDFSDLIQNQPLSGLNVTIPYKQTIISLLDLLSDEVEAIGAVNTICIHRIEDLIITEGFNTDAPALEMELRNFISGFKGKALILGTGGASLAAAFVLEKLGIEFMQVSRFPKNIKQISYTDLNDEIISSHQLIINATPVGMFPVADEMPLIPWNKVGKNHFLFDMVYNPLMTRFLQTGKDKGAQVKNGLGMLHIQAEMAWNIWQECLRRVS
ncbi:MAG: shikimate dehydrogenase [Lentimicrobium sp.]|nr:shikimate dehydrogenase [Lentimicrobium sp.]